MESYDSNVNPCIMFAPGDAVWLSGNRAGVAGKLESRWEGGWKVTEIKSCIVHPEGRRRVIHVNCLQKLLIRDECRKNTLESLLGEKSKQPETGSGERNRDVSYSSLNDAELEISDQFKKQPQNKTIRMARRLIGHQHQVKIVDKIFQTTQ